MYLSSHICILRGRDGRVQNHIPVANTVLMTPCDYEQTLLSYPLLQFRSVQYLSPSNHVSPPQLLDVCLHLHPQWAIVEEARHRIIHLCRGKDEATLLAQVHDCVHRYPTRGRRSRSVGVDGM